MAFQVLTKKQMDEKKNTKSLDSFFKTKDGKPLCFGEFGNYHTKKNCSDCKYKKECYDEFDKN